MNGHHGTHKNAARKEVRPNKAGGEFHKRIWENIDGSDLQAW